MRHHLGWAWLCTLGLLTATAVVDAQQHVTRRPSFDSAARLVDWTLDGSGEWRIAEGKLILAKPGVPGGPIRRPAAIAILNSAALGRITVQAEVRSTAPVDLPVRDINIVVGYESPSRFYYIHLAGVTDAVHNGIFLVADADRRRIDDGKAPPVLKDQEWHRVRVERDPASGRIDVFVDAAETPALSARDTTLRSGRVGFGSFDETGEFRNVVITGTP